MDKRIPNRSTDKDSAEGPRAGEAVSQPRRRAPAKDKPEAKPKPGFDKKTIALVYDFDGTLCPKPMQEYAFLPKIGVDPEAFWAESNALAKQHAGRQPDHVHAPHVQEGEGGGRAHRPRGPRRAGRGSRALSRRRGVVRRHWRLREAAAPRATASRLRHYLISSGLTEIIEGTSIYKRFHNVFASEYWFDPYDLPYPKRVITDTGKTQYLFRINKGVEDLGESINHHMPEGVRPIPFANMIYFGDGDTDVPSMAVMRKNGGHAIAVHPPGKSRTKCVDLFKAGRCDFFAPADYRRGSDLFKRTCLLLDRILADIRVQEEIWKMGKAVAKD